MQFVLQTIASKGTAKVSIAGNLVADTAKSADCSLTDRQAVAKLSCQVKLKLHEAFIQWHFHWRRLLDAML